MKRCLYRLLMAAILCAVSLPAAHAQGDADHEKKIRELPRLLGSTNQGTEFYMTFLPAYPEVGDKNDIKIYVSSGVETDVVVEVKALGLVKRARTIPNDIVEIVLSPTEAQPYHRDFGNPPPVDKIYRQHAVHVIAKDPIIVYGMTRYQYTSDGFLAVPVSALGKEYIVASIGDDFDNQSIFLPSQTGIVAAYDNTKVLFTLGGNLITKTAGGIKPGQTKSYVLNKGDVLSFASSGQAADLTGSKVVASKPVAVVSGNYCANVPNGSPWCDHIVEMELPTNTWGTAYHVTKIAGRLKNSYIRIFAKEPDTKIFKDGRQIGVIRESGGLEGVGFIHRRVDDGEPGNFIISGDKPIGITQYNPGQSDDNVPSDPFQLVLTPLEQFQTEITFNTPGIGDGKGFATNYVNLVFELDENKQMPAGLQFAKVVNGNFTWKGVGELFGAFFDSFAFDVDGRAFGMKIIKLPGDGVYKIRSPLPFAAYSYGFANYDSYGYPASVALGDLSTNDTVPPVTVWEETCEGCYENITVTDMPDDPEVRSNLAEVYMEGTSSYNYDFKFNEFVAGEDASTRWNACPIDKSKDGRAVLVFRDRAGNVTIDTLIYKAFNVVVEPTPRVLFGSIKLGNTKTEKVTIRNMGTDAITITKIEFADATAGFSLDPSNDNPTPLLPFTLAPSGTDGDTKDILVRFTATKASGDENGDGKLDPFVTDIIAGNDCAVTSRQLEATVGVPLIVAEDHDFKTVSLNTPVKKTLRVTNPSTTPLTITGYTGPAKAEYVVSDMPTFPFTLQPGEAGAPFTFAVTFTPTAEIEYDDEIRFISDADGPDPVSVLNGKGIQAGLLVLGDDRPTLRVDLNESDNAGTITVTNDGTQNVRITDITEGGDHPTDFTLNAADKTAAIGDLPVGQSKTIGFTFAPTAVGPRQMEVTFKSTAPGEARVATLTGTGVIAELTTSDYTFGPVTVGAGASDMKNVVFEARTGEHYAPIEVTALRVQEPDNGYYSYDVASNLFKGTGEQVTLPVVLNPGEQLVLRDVTFTPTAAGSQTRHMEAVVVDDTQPVSEWTGTAIQTGVGIVTATGVDFGTICFSGNPAPLTVTFGNPANNDIEVASITLEQTGSNFSMNHSYSMPMTVPAGSDGAYSIDVRYMPAATGSHSAKIVFRDAEGNVLAEAPITGSATDYATVLDLTSSVTGTLKPGSPFTVTVNNPTDIEALAGLNELHLTITFDGTVAKGMNVTAGPDFTIQGTPDVKFNTVSFVLAPKAPGAMPAGELATVNFTSFLAASKQSSIALEVDQVDAGGCLTVEGDNMDIQVGNICALDLRAISSEGKTFGIRQNYPNPSAAKTTIDFSLAFEVPTTITLYSSTGEMVQTLVSEQLKSGSYSLELTTTELPSGVYYYRIDAGPFNETKQLVISK